MNNKSSKKNTVSEENKVKNNLAPSEQKGINEDIGQPENQLSEEAAGEDCIDDRQKNKAVVEKMFAASPGKQLSAASTEKTKSSNCKCMKRKDKFYCYRLRQGAWVQASGIGYPSKESCEANNCLE